MVFQEAMKGHDQSAVAQQSVKSAIFFSLDSEWNFIFERLPDFRQLYLALDLQLLSLKFWAQHSVQRQLSISLSLIICTYNNLTIIDCVPAIQPMHFG